MRSKFSLFYLVASFMSVTTLVHAQFTMPMTRVTNGFDLNLLTGQALNSEIYNGVIGNDQDDDIIPSDEDLIISAVYSALTASSCEATGRIETSTPMSGVSAIGELNTLITGEMHVDSDPADFAGSIWTMWERGMVDYQIEEHPDFDVTEGVVLRANLWGQAGGIWSNLQSRSYVAANMTITIQVMSGAQAGTQVSLVANYANDVWTWTKTPITGPDDAITGSEEGGFNEDFYEEIPGLMPGDTVRIFVDNFATGNFASFPSFEYFINQTFESTANGWFDLIGY